MSNNGNTRILAKIFLMHLFFCLSVSLCLNVSAAEKDNARPPAPKIQRGEIYFDFTHKAPGIRIFFYPIDNHDVSHGTVAKIKEYRVYKNGNLVKKIDPAHLNGIGTTYSYFESTELQPKGGHDWNHKEMKKYSDVIRKRGYYYAVSAMDMAGNESPLSETLHISSFKPQYYCFAKNTQILMADGGLKYIQNLKPGDRVASYDFKAARRVVGEVNRVVSANTMSYLIINDLRVTEQHPFAVGPDQWKEARGLRIGDKVIGLSNDIVIKEITKVNENIDVYDLSVSSFSNFYVFNGDSFFLVHNKD